MSEKKRYSDDLIVLLAEIAFRHSKKPDRWKEFQSITDETVPKLTKKEFDEIDYEVARYVKAWKWFFTDIKTDLRQRKYTCPYPQSFESAKQEREWYITQVQNKVKPNGPTFLSHLRQYVEGTTGLGFVGIPKGPIPILDFI